MDQVKKRKKAKKARVIPGFHLTLGIVVTMLSLIVLIPLASVLVHSLGISPKEFFALLWKPNVRNAFFTSIGCSFAAAVCNAVFGLVIAWTLVKYDFPCKKLLDGFIELPFALPTAVAGITLSKLYSENGFFGKRICSAWNESVLYKGRSCDRIGICRNSICCPCSTAGVRKAR